MLDAIRWNLMFSRFSGDRDAGCTALYLTGISMDFHRFPLFLHIQMVFDRAWFHLAPVSMAGC